MCKAPARLKWDGQERPDSKSKDSATANNPTSLKRTDGRTLGSFRANAIRFPQFGSAINSGRCDVFGRRRDEITQDMPHNHNHDNPRFDWSFYSKIESCTYCFDQCTLLCTMIKGLSSILFSESGVRV